MDRLLRLRAVWLLKTTTTNLRYLLAALRNGTGANAMGLGDEFNLRRFTHLLEKGVCRGRFRPDFADAFIESAVELYLRLKREGIADPALAKWAEEVYSAYFARVSDRSQAAIRTRGIFTTARAAPPAQAWVARRAADRPTCPVSSSALHELAERRRSVREFLAAPVPMEEIRSAMATAALSPSACNRQSFRFLAFRDPKAISAIVEAAPGVKGHKFPLMILITASYRGYGSEREILSPIIDSMQAVMAFQFALETRGLASVCINWPADAGANRLLRRDIRLADDEIVVMRLGVGYPDPESLIPHSVKRNPSELLVVADGTGGP